MLNYSVAELRPYISLYYLRLEAVSLIRLSVFIKVTQVCFFEINYH